MNTEFSRVITSELAKCNDSREYDSISRVHGQMDELKDIMVKNIENVTARGERLELLYSQTENLRNNVSIINIISIQFLIVNCSYFNLRLSYFDKHPVILLEQCFGVMFECIFC